MPGQCNVTDADGIRCPKASVYGRKGMCLNHYYRLRRYGDPLAPIQDQHHGLSLEERLWISIDRSGGPEACWLWTAKSRHRFGYGQLWVRRPEELALLGLPQNKPVLRSAHILAWILTHGPIPPETPCVLHHCDTPACCNPTIGTNHLFLGTQLDNVRDKQAKGRGYNGPFAKLAPGDIIEMRRLSREGWTQPQLAAKFGVHRGHVGRIVRREIWKHLD